MMTSRRVIFINRFYWPDSPATAQLLTDLAEALAARSVSVIVVTTGTSKMPAAETHRGVAIVRLSQRQLYPASLWRRMRDCEQFRRGVRAWLEGNLEKEDILVSLTDPPLIGVTVTKMARRKGARMIHWVQDIFPEIAANVFGIPLLNLLRASRDQAWRGASLCVTPGEAMRDFIVARGVPQARTIAIPNWAPVGLAPVSAETVAAWKARHQLADKFVVMYSGNLGRAHDFNWCVPLAETFRNDPRIVFAFVGMGPRLATLEAAVAEAGLANVHFLPPAPRADLAALLSAGDVHVVSIRAGCETLVFPSKLAGISAVGRPTLVIGPTGSEPTRLVTTAGWGRGFSPTDITGMNALLRDWMDHRSMLHALSERALAASPQTQFNLALSAWEQILLANDDSSGAVKLVPAAS